LRAAAGEEPTFPTGLEVLSIPFGDDRGGRGRAAVVSSLPISMPITCSLERMAMLLAEALRRIEANQQLRRVNQDRELLIKELRHRSRNSLQLVLNMLPLVLPPIPGMDASARNAMEERIVALLTLQTLLDWGEDSGLVSIAAYFHALANSLRSTVVDGFGTISCKFQGDDQRRFSQEKATTLGLLLHELVVNSVKHSDGVPPAIRIDVGVSDEWLSLGYTDRASLSSEARESPGCPDLVKEACAAYRSGGGGGLGLEIIQGLVERAKGERIGPAGASFQFQARFPLRP
jgi:two-component sensor histidine kinase